MSTKLENEPDSRIPKDIKSGEKQVKLTGTNQSEGEIDRPELCDAVFDVRDGVPCSTSTHLQICAMYQQNLLGEICAVTILSHQLL